MDDLNKLGHSLTVVLTLKDRVPFTLRWMNYSNKIHFPCKILIADGGADERLPKILYNQSNFPNLNYEYIQYPYDKSYTHYYAKMVDVLARVKTPYAVIADNDDFYVAEGLLSSVEFLQKHPDYSSSRGVIAGVRIKPNAKFGELSYVYGDSQDIYFAKNTYPPGSTVHETATERVKEQLSNYRANWYDVFRIEQLRQNFNVLRDLNTQDLILSQHVPMLLGNVAGKINRDNYFYLVRQWDGPGSSDKTENREKGDHFDRMLLESWSADFIGFVNAIASAISQKDDVPFDMACRTVKEGYRGFMAPAIIDCLKKQKSFSNPDTWTSRIRENSGSVKRLLHKQFQSFKGVLTGQPEILRFRTGHKLAAYDKNIKSIYEFLTTPPEPVSEG